jgi:hypothetical protein
VWAQWVQVYSMDDRDLKSLLRTFATVFPHVLVYSTTDGADLIVVGSETPLALIPPSAKRLFDDPTTKELLASVDLPEQYDLVVAFMLNRDGILTATEGVPLNTDDNMRIEYNAPLNLHRETQTENLDFLRRSGALPRDAIQTAADWAGLGRTLERRGELGRAVYCFQEALRLEPAGSEQHTTWTEDLGRVMARIEAIRAP